MKRREYEGSAVMLGFVMLMIALVCGTLFGYFLWG